MSGQTPLLGSLLIIDLELELATPLVIRGGTSSWSQGRVGKARNLNMRYSKRNRKKEGKEWTELGDLQTQAEIVDGQLALSFHLPASSLRGATRSWVLSQLLPRELRKLVMDDSRPENMAKVLADPRGRAVLELFGFAGGDDQIGSQKGKLEVSCGPLVAGESTKLGIVMSGSWDSRFVDYLNEQKFNTPCHIKTRSPLDRITGGTLDGALHSFLEILPGARTHARLQVRNPNTQDEYILSGLISDIDKGLLRVGGLTRIGRGRMKVVQERWTRHSLHEPPKPEATCAEPLGWLLKDENRDVTALRESLARPLEEVFHAQG